VPRLQRPNLHTPGAARVPRNAAHLIAVLAKQPQAKALQGGELVTTGTLTGALPIRAGETWSTVLDGIALPGISVAFDA